MNELADEALALAIRHYALEKKAVDPVILDLRELLGPSEWFMICSGDSEPQLKAIANSIRAGMKDDHGISSFGSDGRTGSNWLVLDYGSILVHIMHRELRQYYELEDLWSDAIRLEVAEEEGP